MDRPLSIALLISTIFHTAFILPLPYLRHRAEKQAALTPLEVTYLVAKEVRPKEVHVKEKTTQAIPQKIDQTKPVAKLKPEVQEKPQEKKVAAVSDVSQKPEVEIPPDLPKEKEALYLNYYQTIRKKIRRIVVENYPHYIACGEVCLYFVLSANGNLKTINIVEERSTQNQMLRQVAEESIKKASPFLPFPEELNQPQLSFNVIISFELED